METKTVENIVKHQDELTQESLEKCIEQLEVNVNDLHAQVDSINSDISTKKQALEDFNTPSLTQKQYNLINDGLDSFVSDLRFSESDFDIELTIGYDNKVEIDNITLNSYNDMLEDMMRYIRKEFKIVQEKSSIDEQVKENLGL